MRRLRKSQFLGAAVAILAVVTVGLYWFLGSRAWFFGAAVMLVGFIVYAVLDIHRSYRRHGSGQIEQAVDHRVGEFEKSHPEESTRREDVVKVARNDPCPCGSGEKYKRCCGLE